MKREILVEVLPLFDEPSGFDRGKLAQKLRALTESGIYVGGSSWKYEGWLGQIYTPERYFTRGRFSLKRFEETCLQEYAETFPIVCGDFSFYQFPSDQFWAKLFTGSPPHLKFGFKVPEEITVCKFPVHPRYGPRAGLENPTFLNADLLDIAFLQPLRKYRDRVAVLIFEFGAFGRNVYPDTAAFLEDLDVFLSRLPEDFAYSVEIRNPEFLTPEYFAILQRHGVTHVFNAWTRMPGIGSQIVLPGAFTADRIVARALLRQGRPYEEAVTRFSPYKEVQDPNPETRSALKELMEHAKTRRIPAYLFVNNRLEGNAPITIQAITE